MQKLQSPKSLHLDFLSHPWAWTGGQRRPGGRSAHGRTAWGPDALTLGPIGVSSGFPETRRVMDCSDDQRSHGDTHRPFLTTGIPEPKPHRSRGWRPPRTQLSPLGSAPGSPPPPVRGRLRRAVRLEAAARVCPRVHAARATPPPEGGLCPAAPSGPPRGDAAAGWHPRRKRAEGSGTWLGLVPGSAAGGRTPLRAELGRSQSHARLVSASSRSGLRGGVRGRGEGRQPSPLPVAPGPRSPAIRARAGLRALSLPDAHLHRDIPTPTLPRRPLFGPRYSRAAGIH